MIHVPLAGGFYLQPAKQGTRVLAVVCVRGVFKEAFEHSLIHGLSEPTGAGAEGYGPSAIQNILYEQRFIDIIKLVLNHAIEKGVSDR